MVYSISYKSEPTYSSIENKTYNPDGINASTYRQVDIYRRTVVKSDKRMTFGSFLSRCLCCKGTSDEELDSPVDNYNPSSALVGPTGRSYTLNDETSKPSVVQQETNIPSLIVTKPLDDEFSTSTTMLLLASERNASEINLGVQNNSFKKMVTAPCESQESDGNSRCSTLKSGEKVSFIREILSCRDSFLKSLEWCDNSLTRSKRCRFVKPDEWLELKNDGTKIRFDYLLKALLVSMTQIIIIALLSAHLLSKHF